MSKALDVPHSFAASATVNPRDLNSNFNHLSEEIRATADQRYTHFSVSIPFHEDCSNPYTESTDEEFRRYRVVFPEEVTITSAKLRFYGQASSGNKVQIQLTDASDGYFPSSTSAFLEVEPGTSDGSAVGVSQDLIRLQQDVEYQFLMKQTESGGTFSSKNTWMQLDFRSDRFNSSGSDSFTAYSPDQYRSGETLSASGFQTELANVNTSVSSVTSAGNFTRCVFCVAHGITSAVAGEKLRMKIPQTDPASITHHGRRFLSYATSGDTNSPSNAFITNTLYDETGTAWVTQPIYLQTTENLDSVTFNSNSNIDFDDSGMNPSDPDDDWYWQTGHSTGSLTTKVYTWIFYDFD